MENKNRLTDKIGLENAIKIDGNDLGNPQNQS